MPAVHADQVSALLLRRHGNCWMAKPAGHDPAHEQRVSAVPIPGGFHLARLYPVEGDSAIAELWHGDEVLADLRLYGIRLDEHGEQRVTGVRCVLRLPSGVSFHAPSTKDHTMPVIADTCSCRF
jgi:hypothetical protein